MKKNRKIIERIPEGEAILDQLEFTTEEYSDACKKMKNEYLRLIKFVVEDLKIKHDSKILEIGPGPGWIGIWMAKQYKSLKITGLEISEDMVRVANKNKALEGIESQVAYIQGNAENMDQFSEGSFDVIISNGSLHHWVNPEKVFNEIERVLNHNGVFCVCDGRRDLSLGGKLIFNIVKQFMPKFMKIGWKTSIMAGYTPEELDDILNETKLREKFEIKQDLFDLLIFNKPIKMVGG